MSMESVVAIHGGRLKLAAILLAATLGLGACGGGGGGSDTSSTDEAPTNDTDVSPDELAGSWAGTVEAPDESGGSNFQTLELEIDSTGDNITSIVVNGSTTGVTGTLVGKPTESGQIFEYTIDNGTDDESDDETMYLWSDAAADHAGIAFADATVGVIEKGATIPANFDAADAVGSWAGASVYLILDPELDDDGFDDVEGSYATSGSDVVSEDLTFTATGDAEDCSNITHTLSGFDASYGIYDDSTATGGDQGGDACPGSDVAPADAYISPDGMFMVVVGGCEVGSSEDGGDATECSYVVLNKQ